MSPSELEGLLAPFNPDRLALLAWLQPLITDSLLYEIAAADYGYKSDEHLEALRPIRDEFVIPVSLGWFPGEVLELIRWSEPQKAAWKPGLNGMEGHLIRLFAAGVLLISWGYPENKSYSEDESDTVIQLVESAIEMGQEATDKALQLLAWRIAGVTPTYKQRPFFALAILLLTVTSYRQKDGPLLKRLAEWVIDEEDHIRQKVLEYETSSEVYRWLFGLDCYALLGDKWINLSRQILLKPPRAHPAEADEVLQLIGINIE